MASEHCLKLALGLAGLFCCALTFYIVFYLPEIFVDDSRTRERPAVERFLRKERAAAGDDECLFVLLAGENVKTLTSPNYPGLYPSRAYCRWLLTTREPNDTVSIKIESLSLEPDDECRLDYLQVFLGSNEGAPSLGSFCGSVSNRVIDTNSSTVLLLFRSDSMYEEKGFSIDYYIPTPKGCNKLSTEASATLTSPGYPNYYPAATDCSTLISVEKDYRIVLHFDFVDLEYGENCTFDYVEIFDGKEESSDLLGHICQESDAQTFSSSSNHLLVRFHSDVSIQRKGYRARYTSVDDRSKLFGNCQWERDESNGTITSPHYPDRYPSFSNCTVWIRAPDPGTRIRLTLHVLQLEVDANCSYDFLQISEGPHSANKLLGRYCGRATEPKSLMSNGNEIKLEFQSDSFVEYQGFEISYQFITEETEKEETEEEDLDESFTFSVKPRNATLTAGSAYMLHCDTEHPNARIRWLKGDLFLTADTLPPGLKLLLNNTLWIQNMQRHLSGQYTCVAVSPEEGDVVATAYIEMKGEPDDCGIKFQKTPFDAEYKEGDFAYLECLVSSPEVQLSWEKDDRPLQQHVTVLKNGYIFMEGITAEDAGLYSCIARDVTSGCVQKASATLKVSKGTKIEDICGRSKFEEEEQRKRHSDYGKIVGGNDAPKGAYPWQVMLWEREHGSFCGATLLNERWIATAAHCFENKYNIRWNKIVVKLGKYDTERDEAQEVHTTVADPSAIVKHPDFRGETFDHDLALVRLRHRVYFTDYILPICLPDRDLGERLLTVDDGSGPRMGTVVGWGKLKEKGLPPRFLQEIKLPVVNPEVCRRSTHKNVTRNMFCAGYSQEVIGDACQGDSGGPFMMKHEGKWYLLGIVSWGEGCGRTNKYGFYTHILSHLSWIQAIIQS